MQTSINSQTSGNVPANHQNNVQHSTMSIGKKAAVFTNYCIKIGAYEGVVGASMGWLWSGTVIAMGGRTFVMNPISCAIAAVSAFCLAKIVFNPVIAWATGQKHKTVARGFVLKLLTDSLSYTICAVGYAKLFKSDPTDTKITYLVFGLTGSLILYLTKLIPNPKIRHYVRFCGMSSTGLAFIVAQKYLNIIGGPVMLAVQSMLLVTIAKEFYKYSPPANTPPNSAQAVAAATA